MKNWRRIPGFGVMDVTQVTAVGNHKADTYFKTYDIYCGGSVITLKEKSIPRRDFLKMLPDEACEEDVEWED